MTVKNLANRDYVLGFVFDETERMVLLVRKHHGPAWMVGLLNGIGGAIEEGETPLAAMDREFGEEVYHGLARPVVEWTPFATLAVPESHVVIHVFRTTLPFDRLDDRDGKETDTGETLKLVGTLDTGRLPVVPNLRWLVPLAVDSDLINTPNMVLAAS